MARFIAGMIVGAILGMCIIGLMIMAEEEGLIRWRR